MTSRSFCTAYRPHIVTVSITKYCRHRILDLLPLHPWHNLSTTTSYLLLRKLIVENLHLFVKSFGHQENSKSVPTSFMNHKSQLSTITTYKEKISRSKCDYELLTSSICLPGWGQPFHSRTRLRPEASHRSWWPSLSGSCSERRKYSEL